MSVVMVKNMSINSLTHFQKEQFVSIQESIMKFGCIDNVELVEKQKFPLEYFPTNRYSRKGYLRTRWRLNIQSEKLYNPHQMLSNECLGKKQNSPTKSRNDGLSKTTFDLVNIHLFHDADNIRSFQSFPSPFASCRRKALEYTLMQIANEKTTSKTGNIKVPFFIFGDFNFRLNAKKVVDTLQLLSNNATSSKEMNDPSFSSQPDCDINCSEYSIDDVGEDLIVYKHGVSENVFLSVGRKEFSLASSDDKNTFRERWELWKECDFETSSAEELICEFPLNFPPTYPFEENLDLGDIGKTYMKTRCPAWCDRILVSKLAKNTLFCMEDSSGDLEGKSSNQQEEHEQEENEKIQYNVIGTNVCMGDHKPVYLSFRIKHGADNTLDILTDTTDIPNVGSYFQRSPNESPEKFPRVESPNYIDLLTNTDINSSSPIITSSGGPVCNPETCVVPIQTKPTSSTTAPTVKHINATYSFKETTV